MVRDREREREREREERQRRKESSATYPAVPFKPGRPWRALHIIVSVWGVRVHVRGCKWSERKGKRNRPKNEAEADYCCYIRTVKV
jgi:hypothetical protein